MGKIFEKIKSFESLKDFLLHAIYFFSELMNKRMIKPRLMQAFQSIKQAGRTKTSSKNLRGKNSIQEDGFDQKSRHISYKLGLGYLLLCLNNLKRNFKADALTLIHEKMLMGSTQKDSSLANSMVGRRKIL